MKTRTIFNSFKNHVPLRRISDTRNGNRPVTVISSFDYRINTSLQSLINGFKYRCASKIGQLITVPYIWSKRLFHLCRRQNLGKYLRCSNINRFTWARKTIANIMIAKTKTGITKISVLFNAIFSLPISARLRVFKNTTYLHFESNKTLYVIRTTVNLYVTVPLQTVKKNFVLKVYRLCFSTSINFNKYVSTV